MSIPGAELFTTKSPKRGDIYMRLAENDDDIRTCQALRYQVFYEEYGAQPDDQTAKDQLDQDECDQYADHLMVIHNDNGEEKTIGTYRFITQAAADKIGHFYTKQEYDISPLIDSGMALLELGRSCVIEEYRSRAIIALLWQGLADYIMDHEIELLFGCGSFSGTTDPHEVSEQLAYLNHYAAAPEHLRPKAVKDRYVNMDLMNAEDLKPREIFNRLPPLIKGYLRAGAKVGDGAVIDHQWNSVDVCIVFETKQLTERYRKHYIDKKTPVE